TRWPRDWSSDVCSSDLRSISPAKPRAFTPLSRPFHMIEHGRAVDEAVRFLKTARPLPPLTLSTGMSRAAADHCAEQVEGQLGHRSEERRVGKECGAQGG